jgi:hypothetical protein
VAPRHGSLEHRLRRRLHGWHIPRNVQRLRRRSRGWRAERLREGRLRSGQGREPRSAFAEPAQAHPELTFESKAIKRDGDRVTIDGEITIKGHTETAEITGDSSDPIADSYGGERFGLTLQTVVDRDTFGVSWNNPLPSGEPALSNEVTIGAELQLSKQA